MNNNQSFEKIILDSQSESTKYSYSKYSQEYEIYRRQQPHSESLLLSFLADQSRSKAPTSLWTIYSLVKKYMQLECDFDVGNAPKISQFLKSLSRTHKKKQAPAFTRDQVFKYLKDASNKGRFLVSKLVLLFGYYSGLRCSELVALDFQDLSSAVDGILLNIKFSKTDRAGIGSVKLLPKLADESICPVYYYKLYIAHFDQPKGRFFRQYSYDKFVNIPLGKNSIANIPKEIASFLTLQSPHLYTGHSLRVTSATVLADSGANSLTLKRHGRWVSESIAEGYVRNSKQARTDTASMLAGTDVTISPTNKQLNNAKTINFSISNCVFNGPVIFQASKNEDSNKEC